MFMRILLMLLCLLGSQEKPYGIRIVDEKTGRGVPMVELRTTTQQVFVTDSQGWVAIEDPVLLGRRVFFEVKSHGYEFPKDGLGQRGVALELQPGKEATLEISRVNIAQRLYRITGAGIYRDSLILGHDIPIKKPLLNAEVCGQDSVQAVTHGDDVFWFWGDTARLSYPLGNFNTCGARSRLPTSGGLNPDAGVDLEYVVDDSGFSRPMFERENGVLIWIDGVFCLPDETGATRVVAHFSKRKSLTEELSHGLAVLDESANRFEILTVFPKDALLFPRGQSFKVERDGKQYLYFASPFASVRVPATWSAISDQKQYQAWTPLQAGTRVAEASALAFDQKEQLDYQWRSDTTIVTPRQSMAWYQEDLLKLGANLFQTLDVASGQPISLHAGSIHFNAYRKKWILIAHEVDGGPSMLGEVWYSEADQPEGPFRNAVKIVSHDRYSFYNVTHHPFFDQDGGRVIYFEGTYTKMFSKTQQATPWYDYNQIMYQLDLSDDRLRAVQTPAKARDYELPR